MAGVPGMPKVGIAHHGRTGPRDAPGIRRDGDGPGNGTTSLRA